MKIKKLEGLLKKVHQQIHQLIDDYSKSSLH